MSNFPGDIPDHSSWSHNQTTTPPSLGLFYDFTGGLLPAGVTLARSTTGTYLDASGSVVTAAANVPRFDYSPSGTLRGLLVERTSSQILLNNTTLNAATWTADGTTIVDTGTTALGGLSVYRLTNNAGGPVYHRLISTQGFGRGSASPAWFSGGDFAIRAIFKKDTLASAGQYFTFGVANATTTANNNYALAVFDLNNMANAPILVSPLNYPNIYNYTVFSYPGGIYEVYMTLGQDRAGGNQANYFYCSIANSSTNRPSGSFTTAATPETVLLLGFGHEKAAPYYDYPGVGHAPPSSLIVSSGTVSARDYDLVTMSLGATPPSAVKLTFDDASTVTIPAPPSASTLTIPTLITGGRRIRNVAATAPATTDLWFLETDIDTDIDDLGALAMMINGANQGWYGILGVNVNSSPQYVSDTLISDVTTKGPTNVGFNGTDTWTYGTGTKTGTGGLYACYQAAATKALLAHSGYGSVPVGQYMGYEFGQISITTRDYMQAIARSSHAVSGFGPFNTSVWLEGWKNLANCLVSAPDHSVTLINDGFWSNIAALMYNGSTPRAAGDAYLTSIGWAGSGRSLLATKLKKIVAMMGYNVACIGSADYPTGSDGGAGAEFNASPNSTITYSVPAAGNYKAVNTANYAQATINLLLVDGVQIYGLDHWFGLPPPALPQKYIIDNSTTAAAPNGIHPFGLGYSLWTAFTGGWDMFNMALALWLLDPPNDGSGGANPNRFANTYLNGIDYFTVMPGATNSNPTGTTSGAQTGQGAGCQGGWVTWSGGKMATIQPGTWASTTLVNAATWSGTPFIFAGLNTTQAAAVAAGVTQSTGCNLLAAALCGAWGVGTALAPIPSAIGTVW